MGHARTRSRSTVGIGLSALASLGIAAYMSGRRAVPSWSGTVHVPALDGPAEVLRDQWAVPAVYATTSADAYRIQGWMHATERPFQLDLLRRVGMGRLAELVGAAGLRSDRLMRTLGCPGYVEQEWEQLQGDTRAALEAYAQGVNAGLARVRRRVPLEYRLLRATPEPWRAQDCLAITRVLALGLCGNWESELARGELIASFGADVVDVLEAGDHARAWPAQLDRDVLGELIAATRDATSTFGGPGGIGSNAWVIGPRRTRSGGALLANDPHLDLQMPSVWYEQRLSGGDLDVRGFTFPGVPGVVLGHNGRVAWGFTNSSIDVQDLYLEQLDEAGDSYRDTDGSWQPIERREETIRIKGGRSEQLQIRRTRRGPILTDAVRETAAAIAQPVSIRWDALQPGQGADALWQLNRADDWSSFRSALSKWRVPAQNVVYADTYGNIGLQHAGEVPIRADGNDGSVPRRGDDPDGEWVGTIAWRDQPHAYNPSASRIVTANDRLVGDDYPHFLSREWMNGYRGQRIRELIDGIDGHAVGDQAQIQTDTFSIPGVRLRDLLERRQPQPETGAGRRLLNSFLAWDGELRADDAQSAAWRLLLRALQDEAYGFLGELLPRYLGYSRTGVNGFWSMFGRATPRLLDAIDADDDALLVAGARVARRRGQGEQAVPAPLDGWTPHESWQQLLVAALDRAGSWWDVDGEGPLLRHGPRSLPRRRQDARAHKLRLRHPLGSIPGLGRVTDRGPIPVPGDPDTVWQASQFNNPDNQYAMVGPSHRHIVDLADVDRSVAVLCGGQSGHPASPHYADQVQLWQRGEVRPAPFTRPAIERLARWRQRFVS